MWAGAVSLYTWQWWPRCVLCCPARPGELLLMHPELGCASLTGLGLSQGKLLTIMSSPCSPFAWDFLLNDPTTNPDDGEPLTYQKACGNHMQKAFLVHFLFTLLHYPGSWHGMKSLCSREDLYEELPVFKWWQFIFKIERSHVNKLQRPLACEVSCAENEMQPAFTGKLSCP